MKVRDLAIETWSALDSNRGRSALTVLGIVIGISAVIAMTSLIGGVNDALMGELGLEQARVVNIMYWGDQNFTFDEVDKIAENLSKDYEYVTASSWGNADVVSTTKKANGDLQGVKPEYFEINGMSFADGRAISAAEDEAQAPVMVIDSQSVRVLFGSMDAQAVGEQVRVGNDTVTIVGVIESEPNQYGGEDTVTCYLPFEYMATRVTGNRSVSSAMGFLREDADPATAVEKTKSYLASLYNLTPEETEDNVYVYSMKEIIDEVNATTSSFSLLMTTVASISLLVGGIGIMNMMLTNVTERIREIGLRKALGARRADITRQFMLESVCLCVAGGLIGVVLGYVASFALTGLVADAFMGAESSTEIHPVVDLGTVGMATGICVLTGIVFGWYPARRAARLDPVESLHYQ